MTKGAAMTKGQDLTPDAQCVFPATCSHRRHTAIHERQGPPPRGQLAQYRDQLLRLAWIGLAKPVLRYVSNATEKIRYPVE
jgi:hypothetical protein